MNYEYVDQYIAENQLRLTNASGFTSNFLTIWKGRTITFTYDEVTCCLINVFYPDLLEDDELAFLENLVQRYFGGDHG